MGWESFDGVIFDVGLLLQGQTRIAKLKSAYNLLSIDPRCLQCETYRKPWTGNLMLWSVLTLSPSFKIEQGKPKLKVLRTGLFSVHLVCNVTLTCRKSCAKYLLMWSDLTFGFSFKVKRWLSGFDELSFWWIQFLSVPQCTWSTY